MQLHKHICDNCGDEIDEDKEPLHGLVIEQLNAETPPMSPLEQMTGMRRRPNTDQDVFELCQSCSTMVRIAFRQMRLKIKRGLTIRIKRSEDKT